MDLPSTIPSVLASTPPSAAQTTPAPTAGPTAEPTPTTTAWDEVFARDNAQVGALIVGPDGFIAAGCDVEPEDSFCTRNFVVSSPDGDTWTITEIPVGADLGVRSLHLVDDRIFGFGYGHYFTEDFAGGAVVVTSTDGRTWTRVESASFRDRAVDDVVETSFGTFAIGIEAPVDSDNTSGFLLWPVRPDGTLGNPRSGSVEGGPGIATAIWAGHELVAWGGRLGPWGGPPVVQASSDGETWNVRGSVSNREGDDVGAMILMGDRLIAVGNGRRTYPLRPRAWFSDDKGRTWTAATVEGDDAAMFDVRVEDDRLIARGRISYGEDGRAISWESVDGELWTRLPADGDLPDVLGYSPITRATFEGRTCVAGTAFGGAPSRGAIYCR